ncbi:minor tail protein [Mycobacterium phage Hannaconda]|nr:minor tail protein [Mycobacterium phage Hannaconda]QPO16641.1 minor tail protein [Mycobacterium phage KashFlow]
MPGWIVETITTPTPAVVGVTGGTPTVIATEHKLVEPTAAELVITGGQPLSGPVITPGAAEVTITGGQPVIRQAHIIEPAAAFIGVSGGQPAVTQLTRLTPGAAAIAVTGGQPTIVNQPPTAYNAVGPGESGFGSVSNFSFTAAAGADVFVVVANDRSAAHSGGATYGGVAMTQVASAIHNNTSANGGVTVYRLAGAGTGGAQTVSVANGSGWMIANAISFTGVHATITPATNTGTGTLASQTVSLTSPVGLQIFSGGNGGGPTTTFGSFTGVTNRYNLKSTGALLAINTVTASGTVSASTNNPWAAVFINL